MKRIKDLSHWVKGEGKGDFLYLLGVVLIAISAFGLGHISGISERGMMGFSTTSVSTSAPQVAGGWLIGDADARTYYGPWCKQVAAISPRSLRWFKTKDDALRAGYAPAPHCKGVQ